MKRIAVDLGDGRRIITGAVSKPYAKYFADGFNGKPFSHRCRTARGIVMASNAHDAGSHVKTLINSGRYVLGESGFLVENKAALN